MLPMAGILAVLAVVAVDMAVLRSTSLWEAVEPSVREVPFERGIAHDRLKILRLRETPPGQPRVVVIGSSRARFGFQPATLGPAEREAFAIADLTHGGIGPFEIRSAVGDILSTSPDAVVLVLSEFEITRPVKVRPHFHFGSLSAVRDLIRENGIAYTIEHRSSLYRLALDCVLNTYRFREVLQRVFANDLRRFTFDERFDSGVSAPSPSPSPPLAPSSTAEAKRILERLEAVFGRDVRGSLDQARSIKRGDHARVNRRLLLGTVQRLSEAGVEVVIAEAPNHPEAAKFYDTTIRAEFLDFAESLEKNFGARFVPIEASGPYNPAEFHDLTHLNGTAEGTAKLTRAIISSVHEALDLEAVVVMRESSSGSASPQALQDDQMPRGVGGVVPGDGVQDPARIVAAVP